MPLVSVIMNCYNSARYLREALDSVVAQSFCDWEIVFWDNQSTDDSAAIFRSYADARFRYFRASEHTPLGEARNLAAEQAQGEWLAFLDCDDLWSPDKLQRQVEIIDEEQADLGLVYGRSQSLVEASGAGTQMARDLAAAQLRSTDRELPQGNIFAELLCGDFVPMLCAMVRRSAYWQVGGIDPAFKQAEDHDLFLKIAQRFKARAVQSVLGTYRIHGDNFYQAEASYAESITIIERYLPHPDARIGLRWHQTYLAGHEMRHGHVCKGLRRLLLHGRASLFCRKAVGLVWRKLTYKQKGFVTSSRS